MLPIAYENERVQSLFGSTLRSVSIIISVLLRNAEYPTRKYTDKGYLSTILLIASVMMVTIKLKPMKIEIAEPSEMLISAIIALTTKEIKIAWITLYQIGYLSLTISIRSQKA